MSSLLLFTLNLIIVAWLRTSVVTRRRCTRIDCWCVEMSFGMLTALPLLALR